MEIKARVWSEIDPAALRHNADFVKRRTGADLAAVVKADAYGHGFANVTPALRDVAALFAVANVEEASIVRAQAPEKPILLLSPCLPEERRAAGRLGCIATVSCLAEALEFRDMAAVSLKIDTGMGRIGIWHTHALEEVERILHPSTNLYLHSVATHLPVADEDEAFTRNQLRDFANFASKIRQIAPNVKIHALNSAGILGFPEYAFDFVRAGLMLYGSASPVEYQNHLVPALTWKTKVLLVREMPKGRSLSYGRTFVTLHPMRVATLAVGYADGYPCQASNRGACVLIGGKRCALLGRVTMDQVLVDVSTVPEVKIGDEAILIGSQNGETILASEMAGWANTIPWHIFTGIDGRMKRLALSSHIEAQKH